jgi:hypothetical protein
MASIVLLSFGQQELSLGAPVLSFGGISQELWVAKPPNREALNFRAHNSSVSKFSFGMILGVSQGSVLLLRKLFPLFL